MVFEENTSLDYATMVWNQTKNDPNQIYIVGVLAEQVIAHTKITIIPTIYEEMKLWSKNFRIAAHTCYKKYGSQLDEIGFFLMSVAKKGTL